MRTERAARRAKRARIIRISLVFLALCLFLSISYLAGKKLYADYTYKRMKLVPVTYGNLNDHVFGQALVINREFTIIAPRDGSFENLMRNNEKVRRGQILGYLINSGQPAISIASPYTGIFTMRIDGLEEVLRDPVLNAIGPESYNYVPRSVHAGSYFRAGEIICKIVDNLRPNSLIVSLDSNQNLSVKSGDSVLVRSDRQEIGTAIVREVREDSMKLLWLDMDNFSEALLEARYMSIVLENIDKPGFLVPVGAIIKKEQENIVFCYREGKIYHQTVSIIKEKEGQAIVSGVGLNDMVVGNPQVLSLGDYVK